MATTKIGALKITTPSNLPKNEKDLICMLLAGRLKDLWSGRLVCLELSINDLLKDATGVDALASIKDALEKLKEEVNNLKQASGYNDILQKVNQSLDKLNDVFSLGGLCPSPIRPPKIPDVLAQLNINLFGQASSIVSALTSVSNPKMCLGAGPSGVGVNWNSVTGDLANLKRLIDGFMSNPARYKNVIDAFEKSLRSQTNALKADLKRLQKNLSDPFGVGKAKQTAAVLKSAKKRSDDYALKNQNGTLMPNPTAMMTTGDVDAVINNTSDIGNQPVMYVTTPILDYCGEVVGYSKTLVSGDPDYMGMSTAPGAVYEENPTVNPKATYENYAYFLIEETPGQITVYNTAGNIVEALTLTRGNFYRIGFELSTISLKITNEQGAAWSAGMTYSADPKYGVDLDIEQVTATTEFTVGELDWEVLYEVSDSTTPDFLMFTNGIHIHVDGATEIPEEDRVYDLANLMRKAILHNKTYQIDIDNDYLTYEDIVTTRVYTQNSNELTFYTNSELELNPTNVYLVHDDPDATVSEQGFKIFKTVTDNGNNNVIVTKLYVDESAGFDIRKITAYIAPSVSSSSDASRYTWTVEFHEPISISNSSKAPTEIPNYKFDTVIKQFDGTTIPITGLADSGLISIIDNVITVSLTSSDGNIDVGHFSCKFEITVPVIKDRKFTQLGNDPYLSSFILNTGDINVVTTYKNDSGPTSVNKSDTVIGSGTGQSNI